MPPETADVADDGRSAYHIVCHDCQTELLIDGEAKAERRLSQHRSETGHNVEFAALGGFGVKSE